LMAAIAKSGFSAAFALIFVSEIGDKVIGFFPSVAS
jgi:putative Ca2+/H+ antiporter (TMEM165/GDT1 family)